MKVLSKSVKQVYDKIQSLIYKRHQQNCTFKSITWKKDSLKRLILGHVLRCSVVSNSATPWTVGRQAPLSMEFSSQEYWNGLPLPPPGDLHNSGIGPRSPTLQVDSLPAEPQGKPHGAGGKGEDKLGD